MNNVVIKSKDGFQVKIDPPAFDYDKMIALSLTHNGYQWSGIRFFEDEIPLIIKALNQFKFKKTKQ